MLDVAGRPKRRWARSISLIFAGTLLIVSGYLAVTFGQVWLAARSDGARPSEAIVVLGAAQYDGKPSSVLHKRLDHAVELYRDGYAPIIVVTGGRQESDRFTEASTSARYLLGVGIADSAIRREVSGGSTYESLAATARFLASEGVGSVVLVSDPYHSKRLSQIADEVGLDATVSPTDSAMSPRAMARETLAVGIGRLIGHRRLTRLVDRN